MGIQDFLGLLGGLALFLYGMQMMSDGLEEAAGNRMKQILEKLTANRFLGVAVGAGITAVIQSSSATTVMVVGFVNSGMMTLQQAVWIIMGANIGTTVTGLLIALDVGMMAPLIAFVGVAIIMFVKNPKVQHIGKIMAGLGVLFIGMNMMGDAMEPLQESEGFIQLMTTFSNPLLGILAGAGFTALIQSSSASVGILQTLARNGLIPFSSAVYVLFGQNIGTCITAVLASLGANRSAKRTTIIHLMFNILGTVLFTVLCTTLPVADWIAGMVPAPDAQIATLHTTFNIVTTCVLLPFGTQLAKLAEIILPEPKGQAKKQTVTSLLQNVGPGHTMLGYSAIHLDVLRQEIDRMVQLAQENVQRCFQAVLDVDPAMVQKAQAVEENIDLMNKEISQFISKILVYNNTGSDVAAIEEYFLITGNAERIGDHASNIGGYVDVMRRNKILFSEGALQEIRQMQQITQKAMERVRKQSGDTHEWLSQIAAMEQKMDDMTESFRTRHLDRMRSGECTEEGCILSSEMLTDFERIGDHILNIAQAYAKMETK